MKFLIWPEVGSHLISDTLEHKIRKPIQGTNNL